MTEKAEPSKHGCLFYGLVTVALVFVGVLAGVYFGTRKAVRYAIETYTTNAPASIPSVTVPPGQRRALANTLVQKFEAAANSRGPSELVIGEEEINVLINQSAELRAYDKHVYLQPEGAELKAFISMPLDQFSQWQQFARRMGGTNYAGRYFNGLAYMNLVVTNGVLKIAPRKMVVSASTLPDQFIKQFPWDTLTQPINENSDFRAALQRVEGVAVQDGKLHVRFKR
jgi:hypothetical protein